jgi:hypothetical protein
MPGSALADRLSGCPVVSTPESAVRAYLFLRAVKLILFSRRLRKMAHKNSLAYGTFAVFLTLPNLVQPQAQLSGALL